MKQLRLTVFICLFSATNALAQTQYEVTQEPTGTKILKGIINSNLLENDTSFKWFAANSASFTPNAEAVTSLKNKKDKVQFIVFGGTWCGDTKQLLPQFYKFTKAAGLDETRITLIGVDRKKTTISNLTQALGIQYVPTFIVMADGKEVGRVVEYGKYGAPDKELGEIIAKIP